MVEEGTILQKRYHVEKQIGQGGMGAVFVATDERFGSTVAIKETLFADEHFKKAFKREARLLNSLKHSALPKVSDHFIENNSQYIVMEYIGGDDLFEMIEKTGEAFQVEEVLTWTNQLLDALEYLHGQKNPVIHRDIKPQNLKLTSHGQIVLLDFGLAKGNPTDANHQTNANSIFGYSRNYASLEQIQGTGTDPRSDLYSLAATVYHLITGKPPADALTRVMMVLNEERDPFQPANEISELVPRHLSDALLVAMALNANQRPQTAGEMRQIISDENYTAAIPERDTQAGTAPETNFFSKETKVISVANSTPATLKTERKTEILPAVDTSRESVQTRVAKQKTSALSDGNTQGESRTDAGIITRSYSSRGGLLAGVLGGLLLIVGGVLAGVYVFSPEMFNGTDAAAETKGANPNAVNMAEANPFSDVANANTLIENSNTETADIEEAPVEIKAPVEVAEKKTPAPKPKKKESGEPEVIVTTHENGKITINKDGKIVTNGTSVSKGRVETKEMIVDPSGVRVKVPTIPRPIISRKQLEKMTPAERRKVRRALAKWRKHENARRKREGLPPLPRKTPRN